MNDKQRRVAGRPPQLATVWCCAPAANMQASRQHSRDCETSKQNMPCNVTDGMWHSTDSLCDAPTNMQEPQPTCMNHSQKALPVYYKEHRQSTHAHICLATPTGCSCSTKAVARSKHVWSTVCAKKTAILSGWLPPPVQGAYSRTTPPLDNSWSCSHCNNLSRVCSRSCTPMPCVQAAASSPGRHACATLRTSSCSLPARHLTSQTAAWTNHALLLQLDDTCNAAHAPAHVWQLLPTLRTQQLQAQYR